MWPTGPAGACLSTRRTANKFRPSPGPVYCVLRNSTITLHSSPDGEIRSSFPKLSCCNFYFWQGGLAALPVEAPRNYVLAGRFRSREAALSLSYSWIARIVIIPQIILFRVCVVLLCNYLELITLVSLHLPIITLKKRIYSISICASWHLRHQGERDS